MYAKVAVAAALVLGTSVAAAQEAGWYGGLDLGSSHLSGIDIGTMLDRSDTGVGVDLGYRLNRNFALEGAYTDAGKFHFSTPTGDGDFHPKAASLSAVGILPLQANWSLYGKAGIARTETKVGAPFDTSDTRDGLLAGAGAAYDFNRNVYAKLGWDHYDKVGTDATGEGHLDLYSVGVGYRF
jgi:OmpA-OmpF porin, OOP family